MAGTPLAAVFVRIAGRADKAQFKAETASATRDLKATALIGADATKGIAVTVDFKRRLDELTRKVAEARLGATDKDGLATIARFQARLATLAAKTADPKIKVDGVARADAELLSVDAAFDKVDRKSRDAGGPGGGVSLFSRAIEGLASGGGGAGPGLAGLAPLALAAVPAIVSVGTVAVGAGAGLGAFGAVAASTFSDLKTAMTGVSAANDNFAQAASLVDQAISKSTVDTKAYQKSFAGLTAGQRDAVKLLGDQNVTWQNLTTSQQNNIVALSQNKSELKNLLPAQKESLAALLVSKKAWEDLTPAQQKTAVALGQVSDAWSKMTKLFQPLVLQIIAQVAGIATKAIAQIAVITEEALPGVKQMVAILGQGFLDVLKAIEPLILPSLGAFNSMLKQILAPNALPALFAQMVKGLPQFLFMFHVLGDILVVGIKFTAWLVELSAGVILRVRQGVNEISNAIDQSRIFFIRFGHDVEAVWNAVNAKLVSFGHSAETIYNRIDAVVRAAFRDAEVAVLTAIGLMLGGLRALTGAAGHLPGPLGAPFRAMSRALDTAIGKVDALRREVAGLPTHKSVLIAITGTGTWKIAGQPGSHPVMAGGGVLPGYAPGRDTVPVWASPGEGFLVPEAVRALGGAPAIYAINKAYAANRVNPANYFTGGGIAGWVGREYAATERWDENRVARALAAYVRSLIGTGTGGMGDSGAHSGSAAVAQAFARSIMWQYGWGASEWPPWLYLGNQECVPLRTQILTRRGWLEHDEVQAGDETIGYNPQAGRSEWTRVTKVHHDGLAETIRFGNKYWSAECTPNHRWLMEHIGREWPGGICGSGKAGYIPGGREVIKGEALVELQDRRRKHRVVLARRAETGSSLRITTAEAGIIGWLMGDGHVRKARGQASAQPSACPECGWVPINGGPGSRSGQPGHPPGVRWHRKEVHGTRSFRRRWTDQDLGWDAAIYQSKPVQVARLRALLADIPHDESAQAPRKEHWLTQYKFRLRRAYVTDLLERARWEDGPVQFVLALAPVQRAAWLAAMIDAEGSVSHTKTSIYQNDGPVADAIELAIYLEGYRPARVKAQRRVTNFGESGSQWCFNVTVPHIGGPGRNTFVEPVGVQETWCVTTELGSWTAQQDGHVFLTGNSGWNAYAVNPTSGAYGIGQSLGHGHPYNLGDYKNQVIWMANYMRGRYGDPARAWAHERAFNWYGGGGTIMEPVRGVGLRSGRGYMLAENGPERIGPDGATLAEVCGLLRELIAAVRSSPRATAAGIGDALNGVARMAAARGRYT